MGKQHKKIKTARDEAGTMITGYRFRTVPVRKYQYKFSPETMREEEGGMELGEWGWEIPGGDDPEDVIG